MEVFVGPLPSSPVPWFLWCDQSRQGTDQAILRATDNRELSSFIFTNVSVESEFDTLQWR